MTNATNAKPQSAGQPSARPWDHADLCAYLRRPEAQPDDVAAAQLIEGLRYQKKKLVDGLRNADATLGIEPDATVREILRAALTAVQS